MKRAPRTCCLCLSLVAALWAASNGLGAPPDQPLGSVDLTRGLGMGIMFEVRLGQGSATKLSDVYTTALGDVMQNAGFTAVSIRIDMSMFEASSGAAPGYTLSTQFMNDLQFIVDDVLRRGMFALIAPKGLEDGSQVSTDKQVAWWSQMAVRFQDHSHRLLFRLLNEPLVANFPNGLADIAPLYQVLVNAVRPTNPTRYVVIYAHRSSDTGPGATDFNDMPLPTNASPYLMDFHAIAAPPTTNNQTKLLGWIKQAWQFREATWTPVWSGAWSIGNWTDGWDLTMTNRVASEFGAAHRSIPGIYLMFNGGDTSIYDVAQDHNANGIHNEWTQPGIPPLLTSNGPCVWTPAYHATDDAQVNVNFPDINYGADTLLRCDSVRQSFVKFTVSRIPTNGIVALATLKVYCITAVGDSIQAHYADSSWSESAIIWNNKPNVTAPVLDSAIVSQANAWYAFDVTRTITANGDYSFALQRSTSLGSTHFQARDPSLDANDPQLFIVLADTSTPQHDGVNNLIKFATGMDLTKPGVMPGTIGTSGNNITFTYTPSAAAVTAGITFTVEYSDTLAAADWKSDIVNQGVVGAGGSQVTATVPKAAAGRRFVHLKITAP